MLGGNARLRVVPGEDVTVSRPGQPPEARLNLAPVPAAAVLLFEQDETTGAVLSGGEARSVKVHQRQKREGLWSSAPRMLRENQRQPLRFVAQLPTDRLLGVGREVAFGEQEIEDRLHRWQA